MREARTHLACINQPLAVVTVVADEQGAETDARPLGIGKAADHELLAADTLDLQPPSTARLKVRAVDLFGDDAFAAFPASFLKECHAQPTPEFRPANPV